MIHIISLSISVFLWVLFLLLHKKTSNKTGRLVTLWIRVPLVFLHFIVLSFFVVFIKESIRIVSTDLTRDWSNDNAVLYGLFTGFFYSIFVYPALRIVKIYCTLKTSKPPFGAIRHWIGVSCLLSFCPIFCFIASANSNGSEQEDFLFFGILGVTFLLLPWLVYWLIRKQIFFKLREKLLKENNFKFLILISVFIITLCMICIALAICF